MGKIALIDLDGMIYAAGAVTETVYYNVDGVRFDYKSQANSYCDEHEIPKEEIEKSVDAQPVSHALNALNLMVTSATDKAGCDVAECHLSPTDKQDFRYAIYPDYKANRKDSHKPTHYAALRKFAINTLKAKVAEGMEADDVLSIRSHELGDKCVIVTVDKDLLQCPGEHYNWKTKKAQTVSVEQAEDFLFLQILTGDSIDNIKGCPGIGPAKGKKALKDAATGPERIEVCRKLYAAAYDGDQVEADKQLKLNIQLVRMLRKLEDMPVCT